MAKILFESLTSLALSRMQIRPNQKISAGWERWRVGKGAQKRFPDTLSKSFHRVIPIIGVGQNMRYLVVAVFAVKYRPHRNIFLAGESCRAAKILP